MYQDKKNQLKLGEVMESLRDHCILFDLPFGFTPQYLDDALKPINLANSFELVEIHRVLVVFEYVEK